MLHARIIAAATAFSIKNVGDFAEITLNRIISLSKRLRRMKKDPINMTILSSVTPLPKDMDAFRASIQNNTQFQHYCRNYIIQHRGRLSSSIVYLSGMAGEEAHKVEERNLPIPEMHTQTKPSNLILRHLRT